MNILQARLQKQVDKLLSMGPMEEEQIRNLAEAFNELQLDLQNMIEDQDLTYEDCKKIDSIIETFISINRDQRIDIKSLACTVLLPLMGIEAVNEMQKTEKDYKDEKVMVAPLQWAVETLGKLPNRFFIGPCNALEMLLEVAEFMPRNEAEHNSDYKQLIPYVLVLSRSGEILTYERSTHGGEIRLHGKISIGFGGHVNPIDIEYPKDKKALPLKAIQNCINREIEEEIGFRTRPDNSLTSLKFLGFVNNSLEPVGEVHLGLVYVLTLENHQAESLEFQDSITNACWKSFEEVVFLAQQKKLEAWSNMVALEILPGRRRAFDDGPSYEG